MLKSIFVKMVILFLPLLLSAQSEKVFTIPFYETSANVIEIDVKINNVSKRFIFDTGASITSFGVDFYEFMVNNSYIEVNDIIGKTKTTLADGSLVDAIMVRLRTVEIEDITLRNVEALVIQNNNTPFLIGQSIFKEFDEFTINNKTNQIVIKTRINTIGELKLIPCKKSKVSELNYIQDYIGNSVSISVSSISQEKKIPPIKAVNRLKNNVVIRYFDSQDLIKATLLKELLSNDYSPQDIGIEDMTPFFNKPIPDYLEVWIK